jgi:hypothetical protein
MRRFLKMQMKTPARLVQAGVKTKALGAGGTAIGNIDPIRRNCNLGLSPPNCLPGILSGRAGQ